MSRCKACNKILELWEMELVAPNGEPEELCQCCLSEDMLTDEAEVRQNDYPKSPDED